MDTESITLNVGNSKHLLIRPTYIMLYLWISLHVHYIFIYENTLTNPMKGKEAILIIRKKKLKLIIVTSFFIEPAIVLPQNN